MQVTQRELLGVNHQFEHSFFFSYAQAIQMNLDFADAMFKARRKGLEQFTCGPVKDFTPMVPTHFTRILRFSSCSSSAALCSDEAALHHAGMAIALGGAPPRV